MFSLSYGVFAWFRSLFITLANLRTCKKIHNEIIERLLYAPIVEFFDRIPIGRILNRLSKDLAVLVKLN